MIADRRACRATQAAIADLVGVWATGPAPVGTRPTDRRVERALAHARVCPGCRTTIEGAMLVDRRLRRYARAIHRAPVPDVWLRLRRRLTRRRAAWRWRAGLAGLVAGTAMVALVVGPSAAWRPRLTTLQEAGVEPRQIAALRLEEERREALVLAGQLRLRSLPPPLRPSSRPRPDPRTEADGTPRWAGPDGLGLEAPGLVVAERLVEPRTS